MPLTIETSDRELLLEELDAFARSMPSAEGRARYAALRDAVEAGRIEDDLLEPLERMLEIVLETGRVRRIHGPQAEQALLRLFHQTGRGAAVRKATQAVNEALDALQGQTIEDITFSAQRPGVYRMAIDTDRCQVTLEINQAGVWVENVAVGL